MIRAVGESHDAAHALGYKVVRIRILAILFGGACAGLGGAFLSVVRVQNWFEGMTAGAGWIAPWRWSSSPRGSRGACLWAPGSSAAFAALQLRLQAAEIGVPVALLDASPYLVTIPRSRHHLVRPEPRRTETRPRRFFFLGRVFHASS